MIRLIAAIDNKLGIAKNGTLPWTLPVEQHYFKEMTMRHGGIVLMGRRTYETIGRPLPGRQNFVLSSTLQDTDGITVVRDLKTFLQEQPDVWVMGGASVYEQTFEQADELYITRIDADFGCDQFFPAFATDAFYLQRRSPVQRENNLNYLYEIYSRPS
nr:Dihydrofolate reductase [uncultured bacterium]AIA13562.1 Dihydrofolate reductase [uncultured bacterium]